jgi:hypothetical protein
MIPGEQLTHEEASSDEASQPSINHFVDGEGEDKDRESDEDNDEDNNTKFETFTRSYREDPTTFCADPCLTKQSREEKGATQYKQWIPLAKLLTKLSYSKFQFQTRCNRRKK